jgi:hypothetical protein
VSTLAVSHETVFSKCRLYRFTLWRDFQCELLPEPVITGGNISKDGYVQFIGLNPSTADEKINDPTIRRCIDFSKRWGYSSFCMTNIFPFRATDPEDMMRHDEPADIRIENAQHVERIAMGADLIICAWGKHGSHIKRGDKFIKHLRDVSKLKIHHLGLNTDGSPKHPLYLKATTTPIPY